MPPNIKFFWFLLLCLPSLLLGQLTTQPSVPSGEFLPYPGSVMPPGRPGFHKMIYRWTEEGQTHQLPFNIYLPQGFDTQSRRWPMLTFMAGLGDRGNNPGIAMCVGVPLEIGRNPDLAAWLPMIVLIPQCPNDKVWDTPGFADQLLRLIHAAITHYPIDTTRLYVTGFSDGGKGSWVLAAQEPNLFAVTAPIVSREYFADQTADRLAGSGITCLVLSGQKDPKSEPASSLMVAALRKKQVDVVYAPIPNAEHFIWRAFYSQKEFYQWLLLHQRGTPIPAKRATGEEFVASYNSRQQLTLDQQIFEFYLQRTLESFAPYWFVDNCSRSVKPRLLSQILGRTNVFVTAPWSADIPCRLQTTRQLPKDKPTQLTLDVGHNPQGPVATDHPRQ